jgi:hypothetical protein
MPDTADVHILDALAHRRSRNAEHDALGPLGEDAIALRFVEQYGAEYRSVPGWGWMHSKNTHWTRDTRLKHFDHVRTLCRELGAPLDADKAESKRLA